MRNKTKEIAEQYGKEVFDLSDDLADHPEVSGHELNSTKKIMDTLTKNGIEVVEYPFFNLETSFKATINKNKTGKLAILTEYDALPEIGHGCGHCASAAISTLAALILNELKDSIDAQIDIIGTPDEEFTGQKVYMAEKGIFDDYDFAIMIHMSNHANCVYQKLLALDGINIEFKGQAAHSAAAPWDGKNALNAARLFFDATDMMRQHVTPDVRMHGYIKNGGDASNVVPDYTQIEFLCRADTKDELEDIVDWVEDCAKASALATRTEMNFEKICATFYDISRNETAENVLAKIYNDLGLQIKDCSQDGFASSDMGNVDYVCPAFQPFVSIDIPNALHTKEFAAAMKTEKTHKAILNGGLIISQFIIDVYKNKHILEEIKKEHKLNRSAK